MVQGPVQEEACNQTQSRKSTALPAVLYLIIQHNKNRHGGNKLILQQINQLLTWTTDVVHMHIDRVICKAKRRIYPLFKLFVSRDVSLLVFAYECYVLPIIDYCSSAWSPDSLLITDKVKAVQSKDFFKK